MPRRARYLPSRGGGRRGGGGGIVLLLLLLVGGGLLIWFLVSRGNDGASGGSNSGEAAAEGSVTTSSGEDVLAAAAQGTSGLAPMEDETVRAQGAEVQSVASDEAFWIGRGADERVLVVASPADASAVQVNVGDRVDVSGIVRVLPVDFESRFGVDADSGSSQLSGQGHYIEALSVQPAAS